MKLKKSLFITVVTITCCSFTSIKPIYKYPYQNMALPVDQRVADLVSRMTLTEKIRQLDMFEGKTVSDMQGHDASSVSAEKMKQTIGTTGIGSIHDFYPIGVDLTNQVQKYAIENTRLGIPVLFIEEGLHGYSGRGSTSFPVPIALSTAWDTVLVHKIGRVIATEMRAHGINMILGPVLCLPRDPRWGRTEETYGEDPYLDALNGVAMVKGLQGKELSDDDAVLAEPKHFAVHGIPEAGSNIATVNIGEREARSSFLYVFEKAIKQGGAQGMMAAYSEMDGIPCVDNEWLLKGVLRKEWGFKGFVLSDLGAIKMTLNSHHTAANASDALAQTFTAGMDMQFYDFPHDDFITAMKLAIQNKSLSMADLNRAVSDVLRVKFKLGLFDNPYINPSLTAKAFHSQQNQDLALQAAKESICLLKNDQHLLPLSSNVKSLAVIGPLAKSTYLGGYSNTEDKAISILDGLKQRAGNSININYEVGYEPDSAANLQADYLKKALELVNHTDAAVVVLGEDVKEVGEGKDRSNLDINKLQENLIEAVYKTGKPVTVVLANGRPLCINWVAKNIPSIVEAWFGGEKGGLAVADVLLGAYNPSGKLPITFPRSTGQIPFYYNHKPSSRHIYVDQDSTALFNFGHGLSYTTFSYDGLQISPLKIPVNGMATITVKVKNTGNVEGTEVAQLYIRDMVSSVTTPVQSLKGFSRINLKPGESGTVTFKLNAEELAVWNRQMKHVVEPGEFKIMVGSASDDIRQNGSLYVVK
jgi:beta-glucosidase